MAAGPRRTGAWIGAALVVVVAALVFLSLFHPSPEQRRPRTQPSIERSLGAIGAEGRLVLRVLAPALY
ncbi:hypothetical protein [Novosphingobium soli]|uniref:Uncharacterized protein n=1 Tax=Novosphingobium soli TaxID=574956 RepID=A0ABV6CWN4_9SPHN